MFGRGHRSVWSAMGILALAAGCAGDTTSGKGGEEGAPVDGKADSFDDPVTHGQLTFGVPSRAAFTDDDHFHSWTFTLTETSEVDIATIIGGNNVDTVAYLYRWVNEEERWGEYIGRNDDDRGALSSRIAMELGAGEYQVIVKAHKYAIRGSFELLALCSGEGCAETGVGCDPEVFPSMPPSTPYTATCARRMREVFDSGAIGMDEYGIDARDRCTLDELQALAVGYYQSYWDDIMGWNEFVYDPEEGVALYVSYMALDGYQTGGHVVGVDVEGGDESAIDFVFDLEGNLVALYQHNQSPDVQWFCAEEGEEPENELWPDEDCVHAYISRMPHDEDEVGSEDHDGTIAELQDRLGGTTAMALERYWTAMELTEGTHVEDEVISWESESWGRGGQVVVQSEGRPTMTYDVADDDYDAFVLTEVNGQTGDVSFVCIESR